MNFAGPSRSPVTGRSIGYGSLQDHTAVRWWREQEAMPIRTARGAASARREWVVAGWSWRAGRGVAGSWRAGSWPLAVRHGDLAGRLLRACRDGLFRRVSLATGRSRLTRGSADALSPSVPGTPG